MRTPDEDKRWMAEALTEAKAAFDEGEIPVGAVIVRDGKVIARNHNRREQTHDATSHAEMLALRQASCAIGDWRMNGCTLYVTLEPCPMCAGAMVMSQLSRCVYGAYDNEKGCCGSLYDFAGDEALHSKMTWLPGVMEKESKELLQQFFAKKRKK